MVFVPGPNQRKYCTLMSTARIKGLSKMVPALGVGNEWWEGDPV